MASNPSVSVGFTDGGLRPALNLAEDVVLKLGVGSDGPYLTPLRATSLNAVERFKASPLTRSGAHHAIYSGPQYLMRIRGSLPGAVGSSTKTASASALTSLGDVTLGYTSYTLHAQAPSGAALSLTTGWQLPDVSLPMTITIGSGGTTHTQTVVGVDYRGQTVTEAVVCSGAGTYTTTTEWARIIRVTTSVDPAGTSDYTATWAGPADRFDAKIEVVTGGVLGGVSGGALPTLKVSLDNGNTYSRTRTLASTGVLDLYTYAGGRTPLSTGIRATFSAGSLATLVPGATRVAGADTDGDIVYSRKAGAADVTIAHTIGAMGDALLVSVSSNAITVRGASTDGMATTTTAAQAAAAVNAHATAKELVKASYTGTGASLIAAHSAAHMLTGGVNATPKKESVSLTFVNEGASKTARVEVINRDITLYVTTDSKGAQTTTATQAVALLAANSAAAALANYAVASGGSGIVGTLDVAFYLPVSLATGDVFTFSTTPPKWSEADLQEGLSTLLANPTWLAYASVIHVVGETTDTANVYVDTFIEQARNTRKQFKRVIMEGTYMGSTEETAWLTALQSTYLDRSTGYGLAVGEANVVCGSYGTVDRMNAGTPYVARLMLCPISELPSHVDCETLVGIRRELDGVLVRPGDGDQPLWQTEDTLVTLNDGNFITLRTHAGRSGIYVRQGLNFSIDGSDYTFVTNGRIADVAAAIMYDESLKSLNANLISDIVTKELAEHECQKLESNIGGRLRAKLVSVDRGRQHVSGLAFNVVRGEDYQTNGNVTGQCVIVPRRPATSFSLSMAYAASLG